MARKTKDKVIEIMTKKGWEVESITWQPVYLGGTGREGGWEVMYDVSNKIPEHIDGISLVQKIEHDWQIDGCLDAFVILALNSKSLLLLVEKMPDLHELMKAEPVA